ncbi:MAG: hypothetical protein RLZZ373_375 [Pseudomonadota bacterium]
MAQVTLDTTPDQDPNWHLPTSTPQPLIGNAEEQAKAIYGNRWDADAQQQLAHRQSQGQSLDDILAHTREDVAARFPTGPATGSRSPTVPNQFDDPYSNQLEGIAKAQMGEVRSNPGLDQLMAFLNQQFSQLSTHPGYQPEDLALLNTQALEPIEQRRKADQQHVLERTAARGFLPSSGLTEDLAQQVDTEANRQRTVAGRDLGIQAIGQRRADLSQAMDIGRAIGLDIPKSQRSEELSLAQLLYQMPRNALSDLLAVLNGSPNSSDVFGQGLQSQQASLQAQQQADARNAALMTEIGGMLERIFRGGS